MVKPKTFKLCETPHICTTCGVTCLCHTYMWCCPWLSNSDKIDQICLDCFDDLLRNEIEALENQRQSES